MKRGPRSDGAYDVAIVGAGPAGLSAALILGRCARRVLLCDDGTPRSWAAHHVHGFLTRDGDGQDEFRALGRHQLRRYRNVEFRAEQVSKISPTAARFAIRMFGTTAISARKVLLATGVFDNLPSISGIEAYFGKTALPCSYCDGWEMRGKAISVYGRGARGFEMARAMTAWSSEVTLCTRASRIDCESIQDARGQWHRSSDGQNRAAFRTQWAPVANTFYRWFKLLKRCTVLRYSLPATIEAC